MKTKLIRLFALFVSSVAATCLMSISASAVSYQDALANIDYANTYYKQMANEYFEDILFAYDSFNEKFCSEFDTNKPSSDELAVFAGCYYNVDGDYKLNVYLTSDDYMDFYNSNFSPEYTKYHIVDNSWFELNAIKEKLRNQNENITSASIDIQNNTLSFVVKNNVTLNYLKSIDDRFDISVFDKPVELQSTSYPIKGASKLKVGGATGTVTCCAYKSSTNKYGILTAYHVVQPYVNNSSSDIIVNDSYFINTGASAYYSSSTSNTGGSGLDAAFIPFGGTSLSSSWQYANRSGTQAGYINGALNPISGITVCIMGTSTNEVYAVIASDSNSNGIVTYNFSGSATQGGDSGAPVIALTSSGTNGRGWIMAIHGGVSGSIGYGSNIKRVCTELGLVIG